MVSAEIARTIEQKTDIGAAVDERERIAQFGLSRAVSTDDHHDLAHVERDY